MAKLRHRNARPPRNFYYIQPETRLRIEGEDYGDLMRRVLEHRAYKNLPRSTKLEVEEDVERQICSRLSERECKKEHPDEKLRPVGETHHLSASQVLSFSKAAIEWIGSGRELVSVEESKRRAEICKKCPLMAPFSGCSCSTIYKMISKMVPAERRDGELGLCLVCKCELKSKTNLPENVIKASIEGKNYDFPLECWQFAIQERA